MIQMTFTRISIELKPFYLYSGLFQRKKTHQIISDFVLYIYWLRTGQITNWARFMDINKKG